MKITFFMALAIFIASLYSCNSLRNPEITQGELMAHLEFLAGDSLKGRYPGTAEDSVLENYISREFESYGLEFFSGNGIQEFDFISSIKKGDSNNLILNSADTASGHDFMPFSFSSGGEETGSLVFAGYGFDLKNDTLNRNDYSNVDVKGKWVIIFRGNPVIPGRNAYSAFEKDRDKVMLAKDKGAIGVLLVSGVKFDAGDGLDAMAEKLAEVGIPCFQVTRKFADKILEGNKTSTVKLEEELLKAQKTKSFETKAIITGKADVAQQRTRTGNVIAYMKGNNPALAGEYIVIGAHHDHLGMGGFGSSSRMPDSIAVHHGADDNASGVSALLEIAENLKSHKPGRSIIFVCFGAEEKGIIGSNYFAENPPVPIDSIKLMLNLDMVGRLRDSSLSIGGVGTSVEFRSILNDSEKNSGFVFSLSDAGYGPSDHAAFYAKDKPVLFFYTGAHQDYHTPNDVIDSLNMDGLEQIASYVANLAMFFADQEQALTFQEAGPKEMTSGRYRGKLTLGIMPDVSDEGTSGLKVLAVTPGKPAGNAGMLKGDVITGIDGKPVGNIQDYMFRMGQLKAGDRVVVSVNRMGKKTELLVQL